MSAESTVPAEIALATAAADGRLDDLTCPRCHQSTVSVWFTNPAEDEFRTWFLCFHCDFYSRAHNSSRPPYFSAGRVRADLEAKDLAILDRAVFRRPSDR